MRLSGALLCGGLSRRMGLDKARLSWNGGPLLLHGLRRLASVCEEVLLACGEPGRYSDLLGEFRSEAPPGRLSVALREAPDRFGDRAQGAARRDPPPGPLAGLEAALFSAQGEWVWITSCDLPLLTADLGRELFARAQAGSCDALLCQVRSPEGALLVEPLCGLYRRELWSSAKQALDAGQRRVLALLEHPAEGLPGGGKADSPGRSGPPRETRLPRTEFLELEGPRARLVFNLNTPEDWNALAGPAGPREQRA